MPTPMPGQTQQIATADVGLAVHAPPVYVKNPKYVAGGKEAPMMIARDSAGAIIYDPKYVESYKHIELARAQNNGQPGPAVMNDPVAIYMEKERWYHAHPEHPRPKTGPWSTPMAAAATAAPAASAPSAAPAEPPPIKRGRGRPRKVVVPPGPAGSGSV